MNILILTQYYSPENTLISPTLAQGFAKRGHRVRVLTGYPNYPTGKVYPGYRQRWRHREAHGSVDVLRVPLWADHSENPIRRILNYSSFALMASTAWKFARDADVIYVYATQMTPALAPWLWNRLGGAPYILHVQDLWPDSITGSGLVQRQSTEAFIIKFMSIWLSKVYDAAAAIIGIAPTMVSMLIDRGVEPSKIHLIFNWAEEASSVGLEVPNRAAALSSSADENTNILYAGNLGEMQDLETAVHAAHRSRDAGIHLTLLGDGTALDRLRAAVTALGATNVSFEGRVPREAVGGHYRTSDFSLVTLKDLPAFRGTIPSKFQASLAHGTPIVSTVQGDVREMVRKWNVGFTADAESISSLESAFRRAAATNREARAAMARAASHAYTTTFSQDAGIDAVENVLIRHAQSRFSKSQG